MAHWCVFLADCTLSIDVLGTTFYRLQEIEVARPTCKFLLFSNALLWRSFPSFTTLLDKDWRDSIRRRPGRCPTKWSWQSIMFSVGTVNSVDPTATLGTAFGFVSVVWKLEETRIFCPFLRRIGLSTKGSAIHHGMISSLAKTQSNMPGHKMQYNSVITLVMPGQWLMQHGWWRWGKACITVHVTSGLIPGHYRSRQSGRFKTKPRQ